MTTAETVALLFDDDGQVWETEDGVSFADACEAAGAVVQHGRAEQDERTQAFTGNYEMLTPSSCDASVRYLFEDGSALVEDWGAWDLEGDAPFTWRG